MSLQDIASLGKLLAHFPALFADCFHGVKGRRLFAAHVHGRLSELGRNNVEATALKQGVAPRTLQRFLEFLRWDHCECRGWVCVHRHMIVTIVAQLFCARVRPQPFAGEIVSDAEHLMLEQVRRAADVSIRCLGLPRRLAQLEYEAQLARIADHQRRNAEASRSHREKRIADYHAMDFNPDEIKSVAPEITLEIIRTPSTCRCPAMVSLLKTEGGTSWWPVSDRMTQNDFHVSPGRLLEPRLVSCLFLVES